MTTQKSLITSAVEELEAVQAESIAEMAELIKRTIAKGGNVNQAIEAHYNRNSELASKRHDEKVSKRRNAMLKLDSDKQELVTDGQELFKKNFGDDSEFLGRLNQVLDLDSSIRGMSFAVQRLADSGATKISASFVTEVRTRSNTSYWETKSGVLEFPTSAKAYRAAFQLGEKVEIPAGLSSTEAKASAIAKQTGWKSISKAQFDAATDAIKTEKSKA